MYICIYVYVYVYICINICMYLYRYIDIGIYKHQETTSFMDVNGHLFFLLPFSSKACIVDFDKNCRKKSFKEF